MIRAIYRSLHIEDAPEKYNKAICKIYYKGKYDGTPEQNNSGVIPADPAHTPHPVVLFLPGINCGHEKYGWLAEKLAEVGLVTVTFSWIAEDLPGYVSLTAGVNIPNLLPHTFGTAPTGSAIGPLIGQLEQLQADGVLAGQLDLDTIILGGHSAGGTMAVQNARHDWFPQVKGAFAYAGHTMASTMLGYDAGTILPLQADVPLLIMGGMEDGVVAASSVRYSADASPTAALERTFDEAIQTNRGDCVLALFAGANHFTFTHPFDATTGRAFLEQPATGNETELREGMTNVICRFIHNNILNHPKIDPILPHDLVEIGRIK